MQELKHTLEYMDSVNISIDSYRVLYPILQVSVHSFPQIMLFFSKIGHILSHKVYLNKYERIEISPYLMSNHYAMKIEINHRRNHRKSLSSGKSVTHS